MVFIGRTKAEIVRSWMAVAQVPERQARALMDSYVESVAPYLLTAQKLSKEEEKDLSKRLLDGFISAGPLKISLDRGQRRKKLF